MAKTFNRGRLLRLAEQGRLESVSSYSFDDMYGASTSKKALPIRLMPEDRTQCQYGVFHYVWESDFKSGSGRAWLNENGSITLYVHSNHWVDVRIVDTPQKKGA